MKIDRLPVATEVTHYNIQPTIELTMGVYERDLGHVSDDVAKVLDKYGKLEKSGQWATYDPDSKEKQATGRQQDRAQRRVSPHEGHVQQPGRGPLPGLALDLLPDGRAGPFVPRAA